MRIGRFEIIRRKEQLNGLPFFPVQSLSINVGGLTGGSRAKQLSEVNTPLEQALAYLYCAPLASIITRKAAAHCNGKYYFLDQKGNEVISQETTRIRGLLAKPNPLQSWKQFLSNLIICQQLYGQAFILKIYPVGMPRSLSALWVLPNEYITPIVSNNIYWQTQRDAIVTGYRFRGGNVISTEQVDVIRDIQINPSDPVNGLSRVVQLRDPIINIVSALEARNVLITKKGAIGLLTNSANVSGIPVSLKPAEKDQLQSDFSRYGLSRDTYQVIISNAALQWQAMSYPTRDLMLFEEIEDDVRQLADNYGYPMHLLGFKSGTTFSNVAEAKKTLYQDTIIPEADIIAGWLQGLVDTMTSGRVTVSVDFSHLEIMQRSEMERAQAMREINTAYQIAYQLRAVTLEEWREAMGLDPTQFTGDSFYEENQPNGTSS